MTENTFRGIVTLKEKIHSRKSDGNKINLVIFILGQFYLLFLVDFFQLMFLFFQKLIFFQNFSMRQKRKKTLRNAIHR